ncbi:cysteine protease ATG4, putative [Plasmodium chabaudi adami]|uniref:Cysteine protease n=1 Tax=Plasmodium chabaudi adami TaxID=5826 RepID=A0A1C6XRF2_PLACE|nr:cysteine protease ATG4, putative [Plasmodium chabaudi adami]
MENKTRRLQHKDGVKNAKDSQFPTNENKQNNNDRLLHENGQANMPNMDGINDKNVFKKIQSKKYGNNLINTKNKISEDLYSHNNKSKYDFINYLNNIKSNFSIINYFKMLVNVSIYNYIPFNLRNISNDAYVCGNSFILKDPNSLKLFLILCKSKILFTYRSNFLIKISDRKTLTSSSSSSNDDNANICVSTSTRNSNNFREINRIVESIKSNTSFDDVPTIRDNNIIHSVSRNFDNEKIDILTSANNNDNHINMSTDNDIITRSDLSISSINNTKEENEKEFKKYRGKKIKGKYYKNKVINFTDIPKHFINKIYYDKKKYLYINCESVSSFSSIYIFNKKKHVHMNKENYSYNKYDPHDSLIENKINTDMHLNNKNDSQETILYIKDSFESSSNSNFENENLKIYKDSSEEFINKVNNPINNANVMDSYNGSNSDEQKTDEELLKNELYTIKKKISTNNTINSKIKNKYRHYFKLKKRRKNKKKTDDTISIYMSDKGWGCMIRVVQMMLVNIFVKYTISEDFMFFHNLNDYIFYKNSLDNLNKEKLLHEKNSKNGKSENKITKYHTEEIKLKNLEEDKTHEIFSLKKVSKSNISHGNDNSSILNKNDNHTLRDKSKHTLNRNIKTIHQQDQQKYKYTDISSLEVKNRTFSDSNNTTSSNNTNMSLSFKCYTTYKDFLMGSENNIQDMNKNNYLIFPILSKFRDTESAKYSIQNIIYEAMKYKTIHKESIENFVYEWFGPTNSAIIISNIINKKKVCFLRKKRKHTDKQNCVDKYRNNTKCVFVKKKYRNAFFSVAFETGVIYNNRVLKFFQMKQKIFVIIWVCLKLGIDSKSVLKYKQSLLSCFRLKQFQGISGGNTYTSAYYFYSANDNGLFYIDPHIKCQKAFTDLNTNISSEFFMHRVKLLPWEHLNSSMSLVFVVNSKDDYFDLIHNLKLIDPNIFEVYEEEPQYTFKGELNVDSDNSELILL